MKLKFYLLTFKSGQTNPNRRYRWRYDKDLEVIVTLVSKRHQTEKDDDGEKIKTLQKLKTSLLSSAPDMQMLEDIGR